MTENYVVITFHTTAEAMATEKACRRADIEGKLFSAPRELSDDCGIAWKSPVHLKEKLIKVLKDTNIEYAGVY